MFDIIYLSYDSKPLEILFQFQNMHEISDYQGIKKNEKLRIISVVNNMVGNKN